MLDFVSGSIDIITYLIDKSSWGQNTSCKKMLQLVYDECRELGISISNSDIDNIIEEVSDVNMMLAYFCCKLPDSEIDKVKELFLDSVSYANQDIGQIVQMPCSSEELYRQILASYGYLTTVFEDADSVISKIYGAVKTIAVSSLVLARKKNNNSPATTDMVFEAISAKLRRRYAVYFGEEIKTDLNISEEDVWKSEKALEKDMPYLYCNSRSCKYYGRLGGYNIQITGKKIFCQSCGREIEKNSILLPQSNSKERRSILEEFEKTLVKYNKGDTIIVDLYVYNNVDNCIDIFSDLICNDLPLNEFISYFSQKCATSANVIEMFLHRCFYRTFAFDKDTDRRQRERADAVRRYIKQNPTEFIKVSEALGLDKNELEEILFAAVIFLKKDYHIDSCWVRYEKEIQIDLQKRIRSIFRVLLILHEITSSGESVSNIKFINIGNSLHISDYYNLINYFYVNDKYGIQRIIYDDEGD